MVVEVFVVKRVWLYEKGVIQKEKAPCINKTQRAENISKPVLLIGGLPSGNQVFQLALFPFGKTVDLIFESELQAAVGH